MCGITGIVNRRANVKHDHLAQMTDSIAHRGPDAKGLFVNQNKTCGLGHRRLSILDLSEAANQPMYSSCENYSLVYNGELYNYKALRAQLEQEGHDFKTTSDTEVVLYAFMTWGPKCVEKFNGMFAFALWNENTEQLFLFRDRLGIKPLFYAWDDETFYFSSELKAIAPYIDRTKWDEKAIQHYFRLGYIPSPHTIYAAVRKLEEGSYLQLDKAELTIHKYWILEEKVSKSTLTNESEAKKL